MSGIRRWLCLVPALALLPGLGALHRTLQRERGRLGIGPAAGLEAAPPGVAFTTVALGGFRGLIANALWSRAIRLQDRGEYFEMVSLADWITRLQPDNGMVWAMQAWNMTYNISVQFDAPADRWSWVRSGILLLRDQGLRHNPRSVELYRELAWFFQDKIGSNTDFAHRAFKEAWAMEMDAVLDGAISAEALVQPGTDDARRRADRLRTEFKLDPERMRKIDAEYGPFDWRLPEAHAIYWADIGLERSRKDDDLIRLRRLVWQNVERSFQRGRILVNAADRTLEYGPNLDLVANAWKVYEAMKRQEPGRSEYIGRGQRNFLREAIYLLYAHQRPGEAQRWFEVARERFPELVPAGMTLDGFVVAEVSAQAGGGKRNRVLAILEGILGTYYRYVALGDADGANGYALLARRMWDAYQAREANYLSQLGLPTLDALQSRVREQIRAGQHGFSPALRVALGWTDEPAAAVAAPVPGAPPAVSTESKTNDATKTPTRAPDVP